jgi:hypothetical protein
MALMEGTVALTRMEATEEAVEKCAAATSFSFLGLRIT